MLLRGGEVAPILDPRSRVRDGKVSREPLFHIRSANMCRASIRRRWPLARSLRGVKASKFPDFIEPSLATLAARPRGDDWMHEVKYDGCRFQYHTHAVIPSGGSASSLSRDAWE